MFWNIRKPQSASPRACNALQNNAGEGLTGPHVTAVAAAAKQLEIFVVCPFRINVRCSTLPTPHFPLHAALQLRCRAVSRRPCHPLEPQPPHCHVSGPSPSPTVSLPLDCSVTRALPHRSLRLASRTTAPLSSGPPKPREVYSTGHQFSARALILGKNWVKKKKRTAQYGLLYLVGCRHSP